jgi:hypothetical protein
MGNVLDFCCVRSRKDDGVIISSPCELLVLFCLLRQWSLALRGDLSLLMRCSDLLRSLRKPGFSQIQNNVVQLRQPQQWAPLSPSFAA